MSSLIDVILIAGYTHCGYVLCHNVSSVYNIWHSDFLQLVLFCGRCGGTMGAVATCPLEVVKTRLQSSSFSYMGTSLPPPAAQQRGSTTCTTVPQHHHRGGGGVRRLHLTAFTPSGTQIVQLSQQLPNPGGQRQSLSILHCLKYVNVHY